MKKHLILLSLLSLLLGCNSKKASHNEIVTRYYNAFNVSDFTQIQSLISDSLTIAEGDYIMTFSPSSFYEHFKWDSVFQTKYEIVKLENLNDQFIATISSTSTRYEFLKNNPLTCRFEISFDSLKISKIETLGCPDADWNVWQKERDSLVNWTSRNHPELDGFINDLTMDGAIDYLKAIELYRSQ